MSCVVRQSSKDSVVRPRSLCLRVAGGHKHWQCSFGKPLQLACRFLKARYGRQRFLVWGGPRQLSEISWSLAASVLQRWERALQPPDRKGCRVRALVCMCVSLFVAISGSFFFSFFVLRHSISTLAPSFSPVFLSPALCLCLCLCLSLSLYLSSLSLSVSLSLYRLSNIRSMCVCGYVNHLFYSGDCP